MAGRRAVVIGRSDIVGKPIAALLTARDATVTICHSKTRDLSAVCREADILIAAIGRPGFVTREFVREGAAVVDVGINRVLAGDGCAREPDDARPRIQKALAEKGRVLVGDVDFDDVAPIAGWLSPVPGGVGPLTVAMLLTNTVKAARLQTLRIKLGKIAEMPNKFLTIRRNTPYSVGEPRASCERGPPFAPLRALLPRLGPDAAGGRARVRRHHARRGQRAAPPVRKIRRPVPLGPLLRRGRRTRSRPARRPSIDGRSEGYPLDRLADLPPGDYFVQGFLNLYTTLPSCRRPRREDAHGPVGGPGLSDLAGQPLQRADRRCTSILAPAAPSLSS